MITHSAGNLGDLNNEFAYVDGKFENSGAGTLTWNMTGGSLSDYRVLTMATGAGSTAKITGGTITGHASGIGDRIQADNGGVVTFGGTAVMDRSYFNAIGTGEINLTGGTHNDANGGFTTSHTGSVINISGSYTLTSWLNDRNHTQVFVSNGTIDFKTGWTGSIADANATNVWDSGTWIDTMTAGDVSVDGEDITADNFSTYFNVDENGTLTMVPEPATMSLLALGGMAMLKRRKRA
ncbi:MAG: PEP-CTERM sorting domain-containing protein [Phycisphaerales bacterium]|nr:PEP-CTERM sorting domain-containing protein [Phycisphaerales bacterium]